jgi:DNA-binding GntR family transcriptional regulator
MSRPRSNLPAQLAARILERALAEKWPVGMPLRQDALARALGVSRSPVRSALLLLHEQGAVAWQPNAGFFLAHADRALADLVPRSRDVTPYQRIAHDRLTGALPEHVTETLLSQRYALSRAALAKVLARMAAEGWIERRAGYGWRFLPMVASLESHHLSYRFRLAIEPAALLEPTFRIDREAFARCRAEQRALVEGRIHAFDSVRLFEAGSSFHEMLMRCANNPFFLDALRRVDRLRRLIEYRAMKDTGKFIAQAREHLRLLDLIEGGEREAAATLMRRHLEQVSAVKLQVLGAADAPHRPRRGRAAAPAPVAHLHF